MKSKQGNKVTGNLGESIATNFLKNKGFFIESRNFRRKYGEVDIIAKSRNVSYETGETIHFVEVKSVSYETKEMLDWSVSHETYRPEELVHQFKLSQIRRVLETWLAESNWNGNFQIDVVTVRMVPREKYALVKYIPNIVLE